MDKKKKKKGKTRSRRKVLSIQGRLLAPSHVFYIKGSSKMFFMEYEVLDILQNDWKEDLLGSRIIVIFPIDPPFSKTLRFVQNDPQIGMNYSLTHLVKASLSLISFQDDVFNVFKVTLETSCELLNSSESSLLNESSFLQPMDHQVGFSYKGIITDDTQASSGIYVLDKIVKLIATNLCVVSNVRLFKKGMTLEVFNSHYDSIQSVIFLCGRSFVKSHQLSQETSLHSKSSVEVYASDPIVDLSLDYNLGLKNIIQVLHFQKSISLSLPDLHLGGPLFRDILKAVLHISDFHSAYRSLVKEYFYRGEEHASSCVMNIDLFKGDLARPIPSLKSFKEEYLSQFLVRKNTEEFESSKWVFWNHVLTEIDPKIKGPLIGKFMFDSNTGRHILRDSTESIPIVLMEDEEPEVSFFHDLMKDSLLILSQFKYFLVFESSTNWNKMYLLIDEKDLKKSLIHLNPEAQVSKVNPDLIDMEWIVIRCSPPTRNISPSISTPLEFVVEGKSESAERTEYLTVPCRNTTSLRPGSKIHHLKDFNDKKKEFYRLYFSNSNKSIQCDSQIDPKFYQSCIASHKISEILPNTPMSGINFKCVIVRRWLQPFKKIPGKSSSKQQIDHLLMEPTEFGFVNCPSLHLVVMEENSQGSEHSIYFNNRKNIPYPLGILPGMKVIVTSLEADLSLTNKSLVYFTATPLTSIIVLGFSEVKESISEIADVKKEQENPSNKVIRAFVDKLKKLTVSFYCSSCGTSLAPQGICPYPGCHAPNPSLKINSIFEFSDESGETLAMVSNTKETLQILLCLDDGEWEDFIRTVKQIGYFTYTYKGNQQQPLIKFHEDATNGAHLEALQSYLQYFYLLTEFQRSRYIVRCRHFKNKNYLGLYYCIKVSTVNYDEPDYD